MTTNQRMYQLFANEEEQQNALRRAQQEQTALVRQGPSRGAFNGTAAGNANQLMQQLQQQAQALNQLNQTGANGANAQASFMQGLPLGGGLGGNALAGFTGGNLGGNLGSVNGLGSNLTNLANLGNHNLGQLGGHQLAGNLQLGNDLGSNLGQFRGNLGNLGGAQHFLDMQRTQHLLEAMASSNNANSVNQLSSVMNANQQALLQSRLGGNLLPPNTQLPALSQEQLMNKSQLLGNFPPGTFNSLGPLDGDLGSTLGKKRPYNGMEEGALRKRVCGRLPGNDNLKLNSNMVTMDDQPRKPEPTKSRRKAKTFPVKLMQALIENSNEDAVAWLPDGKSFVIVNPDLFVDYVLKKTFKECKYASFVRKLHRWGFVRLTSGTGTDCFHHPLFQRNRGDLCARIVCTPRDPAKASESEKRVAAATSMSNDKPPSLAGVEKFFRSRPVVSSLNTTVQKEENVSRPNGESSSQNGAHKISSKQKVDPVQQTPPKQEDV
mmetsp:Transcript_37729/g.43091  ORF Transcript_37729/g.43091 Transcript_37729/m.43091 type:complete len:492 (-) Transcript_37729:264-1739(-)|eukprot:CAMPEP_0194151960 /NCGR_PEP_ID=MMETSP0152-20130528/50335_1 /TAXON_ID=1049557 /ORGANISM="Thalassiothrix antarctica, Strain L6-D1" /LENGTH=491 /DNA_ID=CAMNT_0038856139 /DNA_START=51 /DNA_END=1526 /DNA_ORIENTATION=-